MVGAIVNTIKIDSQLLKRLSGMYEAGISMRDISEQVRIDQKTVKRLLQLLGHRC